MVATEQGGRGEVQGRGAREGGRRAARDMEAEERCGSGRGRQREAGR